MSAHYKTREERTTCTGIHKKTECRLREGISKDTVIKLKTHHCCKVHDGFYIENNCKVLLHCMCGCYKNQIHLSNQLCQLGIDILWHTVYDTMENLPSSSACVAPAPVLFTHLEGIVQGSRKAPHTKRENVLHKGVYFKYLSRDKT